jgi:hypothetical protein
MSHRFSTRSLPFFTVYYELFYVNGVKMVHLNIDSYLTAVSLAFWIQDDANLNGGLVLNTQCFHVNGVFLLVSALNNNFGLHAYIRYEKNSDQPILYIPKRDIPRLRELVLPYMHPWTNYKLGI